MTNKMLCAAWVCFIFLSQSQGILSLASPRPVGSGTELDKRNNWRWWTWSTQDGYKSGTSSQPPQSTPVNQNSDSYSSSNGNSYSYASASANSDSYSSANVGAHFNPRPVPSSQGSYRRPPKTIPKYTGPRIPTNGSDIHQWLGFHNKFRAQYKAGPLKWSETLVAASKRLTDTCVWKHTQNNEFGENMSAGQSSIEEVVTGWVTGPEEKDSYTGGNTEPSHFTQVVWQATTEVGCHMGMCKDVRGANLPQSPVTFWACNYNPAGNVIGEIAQNVKAAPGGRPL
ncbi:hypothetical protein PTTG_02051 [Puccinia triticina 1-1 BBBD Race 1]|uniref:SCP domain-containing protein n=2 Tax=Puccinia triticina TaxID=208348 RepID=A0A180GK75_PUCT1|nr:uncharacterized protein PtA15_14A288 [Puccinia triticina]OAV92858.1 hypothetical protein PTTG_02051 [Puccinia triticina 1-1 BBBD Race 1]WAQ91404.1 hypothetical protein PtA15_14A288 [Puccinia triticina]WAR62203.1 hypothetical protein PtB15_14B298 [Puccinia triticina]